MRIFILSFGECFERIDELESIRCWKSSESFEERSKEFWRLDWMWDGVLKVESLFGDESLRKCFRVGFRGGLFSFCLICESIDDIICSFVFCSNGG